MKIIDKAQFEKKNSRFSHIAVKVSGMKCKNLWL